MVHLGGQVSDPSADVFNYPTPPTVTRVTGCPVSMDNGTWNCPTDTLVDGKPVTLTIFGTDLFDPLQITVGGKECFAPVGFGSFATCRLPTGSGFQQEVLVVQDNLVSRAAPLVSYARPVIRQLSGACRSGGARNRDQVDCHRYGGNVLTITGSNFGAARAAVFIGGQECVNVTHRGYHELTCVLPTGNRLDRPILMIQDQGEVSLNNGHPLLNDSSTRVLISYKQCDPGYYEVGLDCLPCSNGTYSPSISQVFCRKCDVGTYNNQTAQ